MKFTEKETISFLKRAGFLKTSWGDIDFYTHPTRLIRFEYWEPIGLIRKDKKEEFDPTIDEMKAMKAESLEFQSKPVHMGILETDSPLRIRTFPTYADYIFNTNFTDNIVDYVD